MKLLSRIGSIVALTLLAVPGFSQTIVGQPWTGERGITQSVKEIMARNNGENRGPRPPKTPHGEIFKTLQNPDAIDYPFYPNLGQNEMGELSLQSAIPFVLSTSFTATTSASNGSYPPDTNFAIGPTQIGVAINGRIKFFTKAGVASGLDSDIDIMFNPVRVAGDYCTDPRIRFDKHTNKWYVIIINVTTTQTNNRVMLAVSSGPTINAATDFTFFQFQFNLVGPANSDTGKFFDYPSLGIDEDAIYVGGNVFGSSFGVTNFVIRKTSVQGSGPIVATAFRNLHAGAFDSFSPMGVDRYEVGTNQGYFLAVSYSLFSKLVLHRIGDPGGTPTLTPLSLTTTTTAFAADAPALGSTKPLDVLDDRLFSAQIRKNRLTGVETLWATHNIGVNAAGAATASGRCASRWYQIGSLTGTPVIVQSGTVYDNAASNPNYYTIPTATQNGQGHALAAFTNTSAIKNAGIGMVGRLSSDTLGLMSAVSTVIAGAASYNEPFSSPNPDQRWGDYSACAVDPEDDQTFWSAQEFTSATNQWGVRVFKVLAPPPATIASVLPSFLAQSQTATITINGTVVNGSGFFDPGAAFSSRLKASLGAGVTMNLATFVSPTQMTANFTVASNATTGARTLTVTNPDGQTVTFGFTINSANNAVPVLTSISPTAITSKRGAMTLTVVGSEFINDSVVNINGSPRTTTFVNTTTLTAAILSTDVNAVGTRSITVVTPAPGGGTSSAQTLTINPTTISGTVNLLDFIPGPLGRNVTGLLYSGVTNIPVTLSALNGSGLYSFTSDIAPGTYTMFIKDTHWLRNSASVVVGTPSTATVGAMSLSNGDVNGDNFVGFDDFDLLSASFNLSLGDSGYEAMADLNGDDFVGFDDFDILSANFNNSGVDLP